MAVAERQVGHGAATDPACVAEHTRLAVWLHGGSGAGELLDHWPSAGRAELRRQQDLYRGGCLKLDEVGLVLDLERLGQPTRDRMRRFAHINAEATCGRMRQEHGSEQCMMLGFHSAALRQALDALRTATAGAVKRQAVAAGLDPG